MEENGKEFLFNAPSNLSDYTGQFCVFFSDEENPQIIGCHPIAEEAYKLAEKVEGETGKKPVVLRVQENPTNNIARVLALKH